MTDTIRTSAVALSATRSGMVALQDPEPSRSARTLQSARIMMVDDEPTTIDIVQMFLEDAGYAKFITTSDSTRAIDLLGMARPDVLLLDLMMPEVSGFDILERMRADDTLRHIPVIVLTSSTDAQTKLQALELGATDFLAKPVDQSELVLRLRNTLSAKAYQDRLAYYDALTDLPNRRLFLQRLERTLAAAQQQGRQVAVLHAGLDRFKQINDTLGHRVGDALLGVVAQRMEQCVRHNELFAPSEGVDFHGGLSRVGGDEFCAILSSGQRVDVVSRAARRLQECLREPFHVEGHELYVTSSIGIALFPDDAANMDTLLQHADIATSHAKQHSPGSYQFYSGDINARSRERLNLENRLRKAIERDELLLEYQPKIDLGSGRICGAEALLRLSHPERGIVSPDEFIPIAEESGLIVPIGEWVLRAACQQAQSWRRAGYGSLRIAVNVSSQQFRQGGLERTIREALRSASLDGGSLVVEMTESMLMENPAECVAALESIKALGVRISIDDFGTGYSSLSYLKRFPLDELKIDRSFVHDVPHSPDDSAIVTAIIVMAHSLGLAVVAEGVETETQLGFLRSRDCDHYQGFLFASPMPADEFAKLLERDAALDE